MSNHLKDLCWDIDIDKEIQKEEEKRARDRQIFLNKCLEEIDGEDAFEFLLIKASRILGCGREINEGVDVITSYYFDNQEHFDCSFTEWLLSDNGPIVRENIKSLFPELAIITQDKYEISQMVKQYYNIDIHWDCDGYYFYALEFNFKELNKIRIDMKSIKEKMKNLILSELDK